MPPAFYIVPYAIWNYGIVTLEGQIQGKKVYGKPRTMLLDWLLKTEEGNISYEELKMSAQDRSRWSQ